MVSQRRNWIGHLVEALVAAVNPYKGGNSRLARSIRARLQPRDSKGRWIRTGVGVSLDFNINGQIFRAIPRSVGPSSREGFIQVYVPGGDPNLPEGFYEVESNKGEVVKAVLPGPVTSPSKTSITDPNVIDINSVNRTDAPEGWDYSPTSDGRRRWVSQDGQLEIVENSETGKIELFDGEDKISEHSEVAFAFAESDRRDIEQSLTKRSKEVVARLRRDAEDARTAKDATPADVEQAEEALDSALFNDPDSEESLELVDSNAPNPDSLGEDVQISEDELEDMRKSPITSKHLDEDGNFTPERKALHDEIVRRALEGSTPVENPTQWMNGGGPGAGKSSLTEGINRELTGYDENSVLLDPDEVKRELPEVKEAVARLESGDALPEDEEWAGLSHEESSYIAKRIHLAALERHHNVIIDGTGDSGIDSVRKKVELARKNGYQRVEANYLYLEPDEGIQRAKERQARSFRKVPETIIKKTYETISTIFPQLEEEGLFDTLRLFDNNQEQGVTAKLIFEQKDGETQVLDEGAYERFRQAKASDGGRPPTPPTPPVAELPEEGEPDDLTPKIRADEVEPGMAVVDTDFDVQKVGTFISVDDTAVPPQLFHVTTNRDGVIESGRLATTSADGAGFGGVDRNVVSFSGTPEEALQMHADLKDYVRFRQAKTEQEVKDIITDFYAKYDIPASRRDGLLNQLADGQWENGTNRHNAMTQYFNERESATGISNPVILDNESWETVSPDNIALISVPKDRVASTGAAVSLIPSGTSVDEFRVHGSIPVTEDDVVDIDSLTDPDLDDVTVVPLESLSDRELKSELADIQDRYQRLQFRAGDASADKEIQRIADRYNEIQSELGRREIQQRVDSADTETLESIQTRIESIEAQIGRRISQGRDTKDLEERYRDLIAKREALQKGEQVDDREAGQEANQGTEGTVPRGVAGAPSRSARVERRGDSLRDVSGNVIATRIAEPTNAEALREEGVRVVELFEVDKEQAEFFRDSFMLARDASAYGSSVTLHDLDYYQQDDVRMFLTQDGLGGIVLNGDEIVTGFMHPEASDRGQGAVVSMVSNMVDLGGRRLDAYDTVLPKFYAEAGFRPVARLRWDDQFAPDDWNYDLYDRWNGGRPDIVFMTFDPDRFGSEYDQSEGQYIDSYETGPVAQQRALEGFDEDKWVQIREQRRERARARRIETQQQNDALKQEDGLLVGDVPKNDKDKPKNQALVLSPIGQVVEVTSADGDKRRFIKVGRDIWKRADNQDDHTRYRSHQIRLDQIKYVKTEDTDIPSLDLPPQYHNSWRPVPYSIPRTASSEELGRLRAIYQREANTADNTINAQRAEETVRLIERIIARREGRVVPRRESASERISRGRTGRRQNAPLLESNDAESGSTEAYVPQKPEPDENGVTDNPAHLANLFSREILTLAYNQASINGEDSIGLIFQTEGERDIFGGTRAPVPLTAIRDALQLQGVDTNKLVETARVLRENRSASRDSTPVTPADVQSYVTAEQELANLYHSYEQYRNNLAEAVATEPADSPRITSIQERMSGIRGRIRSLEADGLRMTEPPSAESIEAFRWNSNTDPDIYRPELIMDALQSRYPDAKLNEDGELVIGEAEYTVGGNRFKYEAIITRTDDELFYVYIRETNLSEEDPSKRYRSIRYGEMRHSARAINNQARQALNKIYNTASGSSVNSWFNDRRRVREGRAPRFDIPNEQGMPRHIRDQVLTREAVRKIQEAVDEDGITEEMIGSLYNYIRNFGNDTGVMQALYSTFGLDAPTLNRFVDEVNQHIHERDALGSFSLWESDNGTPLAEGDFVTYIGDPNQRGFERLGGRQGVVRIRGLEHRSNGYTYTDYVYIQLLNESGTPDPNEEYVMVSSHNLRLDRTSGNTDGSERRGPNAISMPLPTLTTRAGNRYAGRGRLSNVAPYVTEYDRDTLASPTVDIDGVQYPVQASRQSLLGPDLANDIARPREVQQGDFIMHYDPEISARRLVEVVNTETLENGNIRLTTVEPINLTSAKVSQTEFGPDEMILDIYRYDPNFTPDDTLTSAHVGRIADAVRNVNLSNLSPQTRNTVSRLLNFELDSEDLTIDEYREAMQDLLNNRTDEPRGQVSVAEAQNALDQVVNRALPDLDARGGIGQVSIAATQRAQELDIDPGTPTPVSNTIPEEVTTPDSALPDTFRRGPYGDNDGVVAGVDRDKLVNLLSQPPSASRTREFRRIILASVGNKIFGSQFTLSNFKMDTASGRNSLSWHARIVDPVSGRDVGKVDRTYRLLSNGKIDIHHDYVWFSRDSDTGTGFASEFYQVSDNFYRSTGIDLNTIQTARDGSYAWAAANFTWNGRGGIGHIVKNLARKAGEYESSDPITASRLRDIASRLGAPEGFEKMSSDELMVAMYRFDVSDERMLEEDYPDPIDIALLLDPDDAEKRAEYIRQNGNLKGYKTLGREILENTGWSGIRYLNPELDPRPERRKNKKSAKELQKEEAQDKAKKQAEEAEEAGDTQSDWPRGKEISSLDELNNTVPGDAIQLNGAGMFGTYIKQEDGSWLKSSYGGTAYAYPMSETSLYSDIKDVFEDEDGVVRFYSTPQEREHIAKYEEGTLTIENPTREMVDEALRSGDIMVMDAIYKGQLLGGGKKKFGKTGFTLGATGARMEQQGFRDVYTVNGVVQNEDGDQVGEFSREFRLNDDGTLTVYHALLRITDDRYKRTGFGSQFTKESDNLYRQIGVDAVQVHAAWDGSYFWATQGFGWDYEYSEGDKYDILSGVPGALQTELEAAKSQGRLDDVAKLQNIIDRMAGLEITDPDFPTPQEIASLKSESDELNKDEDGGDKGWMQRILYNTLWHGRKEFK
jgi:predicted ABC-type ATPase